MTKQQYTKSTRMVGRPEAFEAEMLHDSIRVAVSRGLSDREAAIYAGCSSKTVIRYRHRNNIPPNYLPSKKKGK